VADTVTIPTVGKVKKEYVIVGGVAVVGIIAVIMYRRKANAATAAAEADTSTPAADPTSADASDQIDPLTGETYAEEATTGGIGYGGAGSYGGSSEPYGYDVYGNPLPAPTGLNTNGVYTTNSEWSNAVETDLQNAGVTLAVASAAIGKVLAGLPVTTDQQGYFLQGVGIEGQPPQGYPQPIKVANPATPTAPATNVAVLNFYHVTSNSTWSAVASATGSFGGNGNALYQFNLLPEKHTASTYAELEKNYPKVTKGNQVAIPKHGLKITLPGVGTVTS
jgi:hypothetical protein